MLFIALPGLLVSAQLLVPFSFEGVGHESVIGIHLHIALTRDVAFIACVFDLLTAHCVVLDTARLEFLLYLQRELQRDGRHRVYEQPAHSLV
jgi:hypothetical protein